MSETFTLQISIPSDNEGYVLLQCEHCGEFFKCTPDDVQSDEILSIYCPACGLISENYFTDDVIELANAMVRNYATDLIYKEMKKLERSLSSKNVAFKAGKKPKPTYEDPIHSSIDALEETHFPCCNRSAKIQPILKMSAGFCPFCGVINFADE